jgi:hypothetical protein
MQKLKVWGLTVLFLSACGSGQTTDERDCAYGTQTPTTGIGIKINGGTYGGDEVAQGIYLSSALTVSKVEVKLLRTASPTHLIRASFQTDALTAPSGTDVGGSATQIVTDIDNTDGEWIEFTLSSSAALTANTQYWLVLRSMAAQDTTNYVTWMGNSQNPLTNVLAMAETSTSAPAVWVASGGGHTALTDLLVRFGCN